MLKTVSHSSTNVSLISYRQLSLIFVSTKPITSILFAASNNLRSLILTGLFNPQVFHTTSAIAGVATKVVVCGCSSSRLGNLHSLVLGLLRSSFFLWDLFFYFFLVGSLLFSFELSKYLLSKNSWFTSPSFVRWRLFLASNRFIIFIDIAWFLSARIFSVCFSWSGL